MELSPRQREILEFVNTHVDEQGYPPTVREIGQAVGLTSPSTVHAHLARLESSGLIRRDPTKPRALEVIEGGRSPSRAGYSRRRSPHQSCCRCWATLPPAPAGGRRGRRGLVAVPDQVCAEATSCSRYGRQHDQRRHPRRRLRRRTPQEDARNGEIVVALMGDEDATVKRFFRESGRVRLQPENDDMEPMYPDQVTILGTVRAVMRRL